MSNKHNLLNNGTIKRLTAWLALIYFCVLIIPEFAVLTVKMLKHSHGLNHIQTPSGDSEAMTSRRAALKVTSAYSQQNDSHTSAIRRLVSSIRRAGVSVSVSLSVFWVKCVQPVEHHKFFPIKVGEILI